MKNLINKIRNGFTNAMDSFIDSQFKYFTVEELTHSDTAKKCNIENKPNEKQKISLRLLILEVLDPLREAYGKEIFVNSGFRSEELNIKVGGALHSHHRCQNGYAAADIDTRLGKRENIKLFNLIKALELPTCELILEKGGEWIHVSYNPNDIRRKSYKGHDFNGNVME